MKCQEKLAYDEGWEAFYSTDLLSPDLANPYDKGSKKAQAFEMGWREAALYHEENKQER